MWSVEPDCAPATFTERSRCAASSTSCLRSFTGEEGCTTSTRSPWMNMLIGVSLS